MISYLHTGLSKNDTKTRKTWLKMKGSIGGKEWKKMSEYILNYESYFEGKFNGKSFLYKNNNNRIIKNIWHNM